MQEFRAVIWHDVGDADVRDGEGGAVLVDDADSASVDGCAAAHALQLNLFRGGVEHLDEDDAEFASFQLVDVGDHGGMGMKTLRFWEKYR